MIPVAPIDLSALARLIWGSDLDNERYFGLIIDGTPRLLNSYLDESADKRKEEVFCVGGILIHEQLLKPLQESWSSRLRSDGIEYFRFTDCKSLRGEFYKFRRLYKERAQARAEKLLGDLQGILLSASWIGFGLAVVMPEYVGVIKELPMASLVYLEDPTEAAYAQIVYEIARAVRKNAQNHRAAYFIDDSSDYPKIAAAYQAVKTNHRVLAKSMATITPLDDKITPALQMADLVVGRIRELFIEWVKSGKPSGFLGSNWDPRWDEHIEPIGLWNRSHMLRSLQATMTSPKLDKGTIAMRPASKPSGSDIRRQEKARRRNLIKGDPLKTNLESERFDQAMKKILSVSKAELKIRLEAEKAAKTASSRARAGKD